MYVILYDTLSHHLPRKWNFLLINHSYSHSWLLINLLQFWSDVNLSKLSRAKVSGPPGNLIHSVHVNAVWCRATWRWETQRLSIHFWWCRTAFTRRYLQCEWCYLICYEWFIIVSVTFNRQRAVYGLTFGEWSVRNAARSQCLRSFDRIEIGGRVVAVI